MQKVARGADLEVVARADTHDAARCRDWSRSAIESRAAAAAEPRWTAAASPGPCRRFQEYAYTFRGVLADVHFDVVGGDDRVRDRRIQAVDSPTDLANDARLRVARLTSAAGSRRCR